MKNRLVVCVDFGSSYTKVAIRIGWDGFTVLADNWPMASEELTFCIPSVVAKVRRGGKSDWLVGVDAANQPPGDGVTIYRNWKSTLFDELPDETNGAAAQASPAFDPDVGVAFFSALRGALRERSSLLERDDIPVRICIPKFGSVALAETRLAAVLEQSGLTPATPRPTVFEPESNALGILSRGNNTTWLPKPVNFMPWKGREVDLPRMLDSVELRAAFRHMREYFGFLVIDIGFFTTDFGYVRFDTSFSTGDWNRPAIIQSSVALGIQDLDNMVRNCLSDQVRHAVAQLATTQWDALKANLYQGLPVVLNNSDGSVLTIGDGHDGEAVREAIRQFAEKVWSARQEFCTVSLDDRVHAQCVTGGGSMIGGIKDLLATRSSAEMENNGDDFVSTMAPIFKRVSMHNAETASPEARARRDTQLVRGGSAIGGASVFFE
ncbi:MAG: hypothetical protein H7Z40_21405 [Phycisphaerae bacterium]|nr:hypothetical protein [Gemmatimonadaceae bacterium]